MCHASLFEYHGKGLGGWRVSPATCAQHWNQCNAAAIPGPYISSPSARPKDKHCMCHPHQRALVSSESACAPRIIQTAANRSDTHHDRILVEVGEEVRFQFVSQICGKFACAIDPECCWQWGLQDFHELVPLSLGNNALLLVILHKKLHNCHKLSMKCYSLGHCMQVTLSTRYTPHYCIQIVRAATWTFHSTCQAATV